MTSLSKLLLENSPIYMNSQEKTIHLLREKKQVCEKDDDLILSRHIFEAPCENHRKISRCIIALELSRRYRVDTFGGKSFVSKL